MKTILSILVLLCLVGCGSKSPDLNIDDPRDAQAINNVMQGVLVIDFADEDNDDKFDPFTLKVSGFQNIVGKDKNDMFDQLFSTARRKYAHTIVLGKTIDGHDWFIQDVKARCEKHNISCKFVTK